MKERLRPLTEGLAYDLLGGTLYSLGYYTFATNGGFATGGVSGLALMINYFTHLPMGALTVAMNLPKRCGFYDRCDKRIEGVCDKCDPELINSGENHKVACFACTGCPQADKCGAEGGKA